MIKKTAKEMYSLERGTKTGKKFSSSVGSSCNDTVTRTLKWTGKVGLMYPSYYGFASNGDSEEEGKKCREVTYLSHWGSRGNKNTCHQYDWIFRKSANLWTLTPTGTKYGSGAVIISYGGFINYETLTRIADTYDNPMNVYPVVYLKNNIKIIAGKGSLENPFELSL